MAYSLAQQARLTAGNCMKCGKPRRGLTCARQFCEPCAAIARAQHRKWAAKRKATRSAEAAAFETAQANTYNAARYEALKAAGLCAACGKSRSAVDAMRKTRLCAACRERKRVQDAVSRAKRRRDSPHWGESRQGKPLPIPRAGSVKTVRNYCIHLDSGAFRALRELKKRDREARLKASRDGKVEVVYQISRIVREALRGWVDVRECPARTASYRQMIECKLTFGADAQTVAAIERHKAARGGNLSATVCDLLVGTAKRSAYAIKPCAPRLSAGGGTVDAWDAE